MGTPLIGMTLADACSIVKAYADVQGLPFLEGLMEMDASYDDLDREDKVACNMVLKAGREMFAEFN